MKIFCTLILLLFFSLFAAAQPNYDVSLIPKELMPYASAVIRDNEVRVEVKDLDNTLYHIKTAITVLNANGDDIAHIGIWYDKNRVIRSIKGLVYNEFGKQVGKFSEKEFIDQSAISSFSLFEDSRVKHYIPSTGSYPYTIEYEYEVRSKQTLNFDDWKPNSDFGLAVQRSTYVFSCKPDFKIKYKELNVTAKVTTGTNNEGLKTYTWRVDNLKALKYEPYSPNPENYLTVVKIAPESFKYSGVSGTFVNWKELGKWNYDKLLAKRQALPLQTVSHMKEITAGLTDPKQKAKKIYEYMQGKTRYISVQVGIGGYQPFLASDVDNVSYGDCKALVNYTQALLSAVGVDSWYCVVEAGSSKISMLPDFASMSQGNHIILCLPLKGDTTFLECTNQKIPFGFLGDFTDDRTVLACTPDGGKLMHTPKYTADQNVQARKGAFDIDSAGMLKGNISTTYLGTQYENVDELVGEPFTEQIKMLQKEYTAINNLDIEKFDLVQDKGIQPKAIDHLKINARDYATTDNSKLYFSINTINRSAAVRDVRNRATPLYINRGYTDEDDITYTIPDGYKTELMPLNVSLEKPFGRYKATMQINGNKVVYHRYLQVLDGTYSKDSYRDFVDFYSQIADADRYNVTLVKK